MDRSTIIPSRALHLIQRSLTDGDEEVHIAARSNDVLIRTPRLTLSARLVEGRFPRWRDVLPKIEGAQKIDMVVGPTHSAVRQAAIVTDADSRGIDFTFADGKLSLTGRSSERGAAHVELPIAYDGASITITLDPRFLADFLRVQEPDKMFSLYVRSSDSPALGVTEDNYRYVIMPLSRDK